MPHLWAAKHGVSSRLDEHRHAPSLLRLSDCSRATLARERDGLEGREEEAGCAGPTACSSRAPPQRGAEVPCSSRAITGNLARLVARQIAAHRVWPHQVLLRASFEGEWRERGAQEGRAYSQRSQLEVQLARCRGGSPRSRCFGSAGAQATAGERRQHKMGCACAS